MGSVVTIGVFDGVHLGHQALVSTAVAAAASAGERAWVVTFDPNPVEVLRPDAAPTRLCSVERRVEILSGLGIDSIEVLRFDQTMAATTPQEFIKSVLSPIDATHVVVGEGFRFGNRASGTVDTLREAGLSVVEQPLLGGTEPVSSTRVRAAIAGGDVQAAAHMLGRPPEVDGLVVQGAQRGRDLGFPTANVQHHRLAAVPADGVYAGHAHFGGRAHPAAISIGTNPTFDGVERTVEAYVLDFDADLYGQQLRVTFSDRLRPTVAFESVEALIEQMHADVEATRAALD